MVTENKKAKADPAPKSGVVAKAESAVAADGAKAGAKVAETKAAETKAAETKAEAKPDAGEPAAAPSNYSRGEGQKPVTTAYKENWNLIFGKKSKKKKR
jgi:hypothetical protein